MGNGACSSSFSQASLDAEASIPQHDQQMPMLLFNDEYVNSRALSPTKPQMLPYKPNIADEECDDQFEIILSQDDGMKSLLEVESPIKVSRLARTQSPTKRRKNPAEQEQYFLAMLNEDSQQRASSKNKSISPVRIIVEKIKEKDRPKTYTNQTNVQLSDTTLMRLKTPSMIMNEALIMSPEFHPKPILRTSTKSDKSLGSQKTKKSVRFGKVTR